jgi:hypothetical protein
LISTLLTLLPLDILRADGIAPSDPCSQTSRAGKRKADTVDDEEDEGDDEEEDDDGMEERAEAELKVLLVCSIGSTQTLAFSNGMSRSQGKGKSDSIIACEESKQVPAQNKEEGQDRGSSDADLRRSHRPYLTILSKLSTSLLFKLLLTKKQLHF